MKDLSLFGQRFCAESGTFTLMDDLGKALTTNPDMLFLGGGNPARIPAIEAEIKNAIELKIQRDDGVLKVAGNYQSPQGDPDFLSAVAGFLQRQCQWPVTPENIALANGSQAAFFVLFNMYAGDFGDHKKQILLPMAPEYIGYSSSGLVDDLFVSTQPKIERLANRQFKYVLDFDEIETTLKQGSIGAICLSRPTNPTGNMVSDEELAHLSQLAVHHNIPLIIDAAYGLPFPGIVFTEATSVWNPDAIYLLSLSKVGMPGVRTGIIVGNSEAIANYTRANTALNLACSSAGPAITHDWFASDKLATLSKEIIQPFYKSACDLAVRTLLEACDDLPVRVHLPQGAMFLWLWCEGLPISSEELYQRLKRRGVLVLSGHHFFIGCDPNWAHSQQCLRVSYCQSKEVIEQAAAILSEELRLVYGASD